MAQIQSPETYVDGQQVTATRLNNQTNGAILLPGSITDHPNITANTVASDDSVLLYDQSAAALREANVSDVLGSNLPVVTSSVTGGANSDIIITPNDGTIVTGVAYTSSNGLTVSVTSTAHTLAVGQVILITAAGTGYNGTFRVATIATNSFTYVMTTAATAGSGTLSYTKKGLVKNPANETIAGNLYVDGSLVVAGPTVVTGSTTYIGPTTMTGDATSNGAFTSNGTANFTGTIQVNAEVGYLLTSISEYTIPNKVALGGNESAVWTSPTFTKPAGEFWVFEVDYTEEGRKGYGYSIGFRYGSQTAFGGRMEYQRDFTDAQGGSWYSGQRTTGRWVSSTAETFTNETVKCDISAGSGSGANYFVTTSATGWGTYSPSKLRIYKYKTA